MTPLHDTIGADYRRYRQPDSRIAAAILSALGTAESVVNVGAGTGSYEPRDRLVVAVEPSVTMIRQRASNSAPVVQASAMQLPFGDGAFSAALAVLTVHYWADRARGLEELARVARERVVLLVRDPDYAGFWLVDDYLPQIAEIDRRTLPSIAELRRALGTVDVHPLPIPHDCTDGFMGAYWRRPSAYLDAGVRGGLSMFANLQGMEPSLARLRRDLQDGIWEHRYGHILARSEMDVGYRLIVWNKSKAIAKTGTSTYAAIRQAIIGKQIVEAVYDGHRRWMCPHTLGMKNGREHGFFYQFGGTSTSGLWPDGSGRNWRCINIDELQDVTIVDGEWHTAANYASSHTCVDILDVEVAL